MILEETGNALASAERARVALVVEDEWMILMEIADTLGSAGWTVLEADAGETALKILRANRSTVVLVTDIRLGEGMNGWQLAMEARKLNPDIGVIYASANDQLSSEMVPGGVFLTKPCLATEIAFQAEGLQARG